MEFRLLGRRCNGTFHQKLASASKFSLKLANVTEAKMKVVNANEIQESFKVDDEIVRRYQTFVRKHKDWRHGLFRINLLILDIPRVQ